MFFGLGGAATITTVIISFNNPRGLIWLLLGTVKVLICSTYVHVDLLNVNWIPKPLYLIIITTAVFSHLIEKYGKFEWELVLYRLMLLSAGILIASLLHVPWISDQRDYLIAIVYLFALTLIFVNSLARAHVLSGDQVQKLNRLLKNLGCNCQPFERQNGWVRRWV